MSALVVDASIAAKWFTREPHAEAALSILDEQHQLHAPDFLFLEIDSVIGKWIRRGVINTSEGKKIRSAIRSVPIHAHSFLTFQDSAYQIAVQTSQSVYDCLYVSLAVFLNARMVTADRRLYEGLAGGPYGAYMLWVEDIGKSK